MKSSMQFAAETGYTVSRITQLARAGLIPGARLNEWHRWEFPDDAKLPKRRRYARGKKQ